MAYKVYKEEAAQLEFNQTLLETATEVSQALSDYKLYKALGI